MAAFNDLYDLLASGKATFSRPSAGCYLSSTGNYQSFGPNEPRLGDLGLLVEPASTNRIINSSFAGAEVGVPGVLPPGLAVNSGNGVGVTAVEALGFDRGLPYIDLRISGTATGAPATVTLIFESQIGINMPVLPGEAVVQTARIAVLSGDVSGLSFFQMATGRFNGATFVGNGGVASLAEASSELQWFECTDELPDTGVTGARPSVNLRVPEGENLDIVLRLSAPQFERGRTEPSTPIITAGDEVTRAADLLTIYPDQASYDVLYTFAGRPNLILRGLEIKVDGYAVGAGLGQVYILGFGTDLNPPSPPPPPPEPPVFFGPLIDTEEGAIEDEQGAGLTGQITEPLLSTSLIREAWASREGGQVFGIAVKPENLGADAEYWDLVQREAGMLVPETALSPMNVQNVRGVFTFGKADSFMAYAKSTGLPYKLPSGLIYPRHDMAWVSTYDEGTGQIIPTLDGHGQPNINASNVLEELDTHISTIAAQPWAADFRSINVSNELIDPTKADGWREHPWHTATNGPSWLVYAFSRARELWPTTPLGLCQDLTEQTPDWYGIQLRAHFLANLEELLRAGAQIDYVDLQGHLRLEWGYDPLAHRTFLQDVASLGVKIAVGELDVIAVDPTAYTTGQYEEAAAYMIAQYLNVIVPFVHDDITVWGLADRYQTWGAGQQPLLFDDALAKKPQMYRAIYNALAWR